MNGRGKSMIALMRAQSAFTDNVQNLSHFRE